MGLFSSEPNAIERVVIKATDENLTTEDWSRIIEVCDEVNTKPSKNGPLAIEALQKRLMLPNGNVQLFSLTLLNALAQNCGPSVKREIASTATTSCLSRLGTSPATYPTVIARLIDILGQLAEQFASDPTLAQIQMTFDRVCKAHPSMAPKKASTGNSRSSKSSSAHHGSKLASKSVRPTAVSNGDDEEDEELRRALELSLREMGQPQTEVEAASRRPLQTPARHVVRALYDFTASEEGELTFRAGDVIEVIDRVYKEWWKGVLSGREGIFPVNYVEAVSEPDHQNELESGSLTAAASGSASVASSGSKPQVTVDENYIFAQVPAVEKLLTILASASQSGDGGSVIGNKDIQLLYHQIASMRPRLIQLIDEYSVKKQELVDLNQKLLQARRSYERLMADAATGQYRQHMYHQNTSSVSHVSSPAVHPQATGGYSGLPAEAQNPMAQGQVPPEQTVHRAQPSFPPQQMHDPQLYVQSPQNIPPPQQQQPYYASTAPGYTPQGPAQMAHAQPDMKDPTDTYRRQSYVSQGAPVASANLSHPGQPPHLSQTAQPTQPLYDQQPYVPYSATQLSSGPQPSIAPKSPPSMHETPSYDLTSQQQSPYYSSRSSMTHASAQQGYRLPYPDDTTQQIRPAGSVNSSPYSNGVATTAAESRP